ncbi:MAG TPA: FAD:protein FMN transferase, partial [Candidatus Saccharimonadales bacterium]|nr:FAD:protein FMN transferase [Candidatus Saccharimonadales bacterium]
WGVVEEFENRFSRFDANSETSKFNQRAGSYVSVSREFRELLEACARLYMETDGLFNPFILPNLQRQGYLGSWPTPANYQDSVDYRDRQALPDISKLKINGNQARIPINSAIDFGGIGKGYLLDQLSDYLERHKFGRYWLSLGGDIICNGLDIDDQPWLIKIQHATQPDELVGNISNEGKKLAIATSGVTKRKGKNWHHIIDPRTGESADTDFLNVTVVYQNACTADVLAKCLVIIGSKSANRFVQEHSIKSAYAQTTAGKVLRLGGRIRAL